MSIRERSAALNESTDTEGGVINRCLILKLFSSHPPLQAPEGESPGASLLGFLRKFGREFDFRTTGIAIVAGNPSGEVSLSQAYREGWAAGSDRRAPARADSPATRLHVRDPVTMDSDVGAPCKKIEEARRPAFNRSKAPIRSPCALAGNRASFCSVSVV